MASPSTVPPQLAAVLASEGIAHYLPADPEFAGLQATWISNPAQPLVIVRPQTAAQVASVVSACAAAGQALVVRSGGHDTNGRTTVAGAVQIDLRLLDNVVVAADRKTARVGGGANLIRVVNELSKEGLTTPVGSVDNVGYTGWATGGGYGMYSSEHGLGADQIVSAQLVNAEGKIVEASERVLRAMRGGGASNWGVVVELETKVYPLQEMQAGPLIFDSTDLKATATTFYSNFEKLIATTPLPPNLCIQMFSPSAPQTVFLVIFIWNGPASAESKIWQDRIAALGPCVAQQVGTTTPAGQLQAVSAMVPPAVYGRLETVSLTHFSPEAVAALAEVLTTMPSPSGSGVSVHQLVASSPSCGPHEDAVFRVREPHYMLELVGVHATPEAAEESMRWATQARERLAAVDTALEATYYPLTNVHAVDLKTIFGSNLDELVALKKEVDPNLVFKHALPQL